jgi:hypothetical protein
MSAPPESPSKGKELIAAYRAARLSQRPVLRTSLHQSHVARRAARIGAAAFQEAEAPAPAEPAAPPAPAAAAESGDLASVFASLVNSSAAPEAAAEEEEAPPPENPDPPPVVDDPPPAAYDPPLAEIGFGPGMLIRLSQLGVHSTAELAHADPAVLRAALGDISRLVDVEAWIASARHSVAGAAKAKINSAA